MGTAGSFDYACSSTSVLAMSVSARGNAEGMQGAIKLSARAICERGTEAGQLLGLFSTWPDITLQNSSRPRRVFDPVDRPRPQIIRPSAGVVAERGPKVPP